MKGERGQALVETLLLGLLLLVPLIWLLGVMAELHRAALATTAAVRDAGVGIARTGDRGEAVSALDRAVRRALSDHQLDPSRAEVQWTSGAALERGGRFEIRVGYPVTVARFPLLGSVGGPAVWVDARHVARSHPFISRP